jgi:hypothetical protein
MKIAFSARVLVAWWVGIFCSGCSGVLLNRVPDVNRYSWEKGRTFTRPEVIQALGQPGESTVFPRPQTVGALAARKHPAFPRPLPADVGRPAFRGYVANPAGRIRSIDEYVLKGPIVATGSDLVGVVWTKQLAVVSLGLSELMMFPSTVHWILAERKKVYRLYMAYNRTGELVAHRLVRVGE